MSGFYERYASGSQVPEDIFSISIMLLAGFLISRITKKLKLPNVTAYILAGILIGPYALNLIPARFVENSGFLPDIALAFIAFGIGEFFRTDTLKKSGLKVFIITLCETLLSAGLVLILCLGIFKLPLVFSIVMAALAATTAPASTMMTIRQTKAKGEFVDVLLQVVALDDIVGLIAYSIAISIATSYMAGASVSFWGSFLPFFINIMVLILGGIFGLFIVLFMKYRHSTDNRLIIAIAMLFTFCGIASLLGTSPLLGCMAMGSVYINMTDDDSLFKQLNYFSPPILLLFFVRSGISFNLKALFSTGSFGVVPLIWIGIGYFLVRLIGKYFGSMLGGKIVKTSSALQKNLGLALIPQASVAIGLAQMGARSLNGETGEALLTIVLASSILYELIGPAAAKFALYRSGSYDDTELNVDKKNAEVDNRQPNTEALKTIQKSISSDLNGIENIEERFYDEAALEYYEGMEDLSEIRKINLDKKKKGKEKTKKDKKKKAKD